MDLKRALSRLIRLTPGAHATMPLKQAAELGLLKTLQGGGLRAVERLVAGLNAGGHRFKRVSQAAGTRTWREQLDGGKRTLDIYVASIGASSVRYAEVAKRQAENQHFYDRYMEIGQKAYRDPSYRLSAMDRRLLLVGELEADVNNGGFSQYLSNKGRRRARSALAALKAIGARKTAAMLEEAMAPDVAEARLSTLDDRFYNGAENLAVLAARHVKR